MNNINSVKQEITDKLLELFPTYTIYDEDMQEDFQKPSFLISLTQHTYSKQINVRFSSVLTFDIAYFNNAASGVKKDCVDTQEVLLEKFCRIGSYLVQNKQGKITDNVLHFTFTIKYSKIVESIETKMQHPQIRTRTEE